MLAGPDASNQPPLREFLDLMEAIGAHFRPRMERVPSLNDDRLRRLTMPLLVIAGDHDVMLDSQETTRRLEALVTHADVRLLPGVGHVILGQGPAIAEFPAGDMAAA